MAGESELSVSYADLLAEVLRFLGYGSDSAAWTDAQKAEADAYVQAGLRRFYYPPASEAYETGYAWSFLNPVRTLATVADQGEQDLPSDLGRVLGDFHYEASVFRQSIVQVSETRMQELRSRTTSTGRPTHATVRVKPKEASLGQRLEVAWWPVPDAAYTLTFRYEAFNGKLSADNPHPLGGMRHAELLIESCLAVAEQKANDERGLHTAEFERLMAAAIQNDRRMGARYYGHMGECADQPSMIPRHGMTPGTYQITYNGVDVDA